MVTKKDTSCIILTYKGKLLMLLHDTNPEVYDNPSNTSDSHWSFLSAEKEDNKTHEASIKGKVEKITGIKLTSIIYLTKIRHEDKDEDFFQAKLTDENVNNMHRENNQVLQFFSLREVEKLNLEPFAQEFVDNNLESLSV